MANRTAAICLRVIAAEGHSTVEILGTQPRVHQRLQEQVSRLEEGGS